MRRASTCLALLGLIVLGLPAVAAATPEVIFKAKAVPIPKPGGGTYPGTGNIYGAGAAVQAEYEIKGTEYAGGPPPISGVNFYLPKGSQLHPQGFVTCPVETLKNVGKAGCSAKSKASPVGHALGEVTFGKTRVPEEATLEAFFVPGGGLGFLVEGTEPVQLTFVSAGKYVNASGLYGKELITEVPAIATVPEAPLAATKTIKITAGAAYMQGKKLISYGTIPKKGLCPKGGFPVKTEVKFGGSFGPGREFGIPEQTVTKTLRTPCPKH